MTFFLQAPLLATILALSGYWPMKQVDASSTRFHEEWTGPTGVIYASLRARIG